MNLARKVMKTYEVEAPQEEVPSSYLILGFEGEPDLEHNHVTVVYFGKKSEDEIEEIREKIEDWFLDNEPTAFNARFSEEAMFGPEKDIRVLKADDPEQFFPDLKKMLAPYDASKFKDTYNPHVTTDREVYEGAVTRLILSHDGYQTIDEWPLFDAETEE